MLPMHRYTGPYNPLHIQLDSKDRPLSGQEPYNEVDAIAMRHDICYRDNENGKADCDRKMLAELNALTPREGHQKIDRQLVRGIIGLKHRLGMSVHWSSRLADELHRSGSASKNAACLLNRSMTSGLRIWSTCQHTHDQTVATNIFSL